MRSVQGHRGPESQCLDSAVFDSKCYCFRLRRLPSAAPGCATENALQRNQAGSLSDTCFYLAPNPGLSQNILPAACTAVSAPSRGAQWACFLFMPINAGNHVPRKTDSCGVCLCFHFQYQSGVGSFQFSAVWTMRRHEIAHYVRKKMFYFYHYKKYTSSQYSHIIFFYVGHYPLLKFFGKANAFDFEPPNKQCVYF